MATPKQEIQTDKNENRCFKCERRFKMEYELTLHHQLHTDQRVFRCTSCYQTFNRHHSLVFHFSYVHMGERLFSCQICKKVFQSKGHLSIHLQIHSQVFVCAKCDKSFRQKSSLKRHLQEHRERPFTCLICNKLFIQHDNFECHMKTIHDGNSISSCSGNMGKGQVLSLECHESLECQSISHLSGADKRDESNLRSSWSKAKQLDLHTSDTPFAMEIKIEDDLE